MIRHSTFKPSSIVSPRVLLGMVAWLFTTLCWAQNSRPKIGLVLSGGGAKGIAHIGVLKAMEEAGLTPDYITGTSMGSIVGGLYACGYSADELKEIVEAADWSTLFSNKIPFNNVTFEEKYYYGRYPFEFYIKNKALQLPKGIIEGHGLIKMFSDLTRPVHNITDFNDLPIPFACVASDIATGEPIILNKGSLAISMRASMAIPSVFTPVNIDNHLLVDGGLVRNMPVEEVINMGADIVIGVFVSNDLEPVENLNNALSILSQSAFITSAFDTRNQLAKCNILIKPDLLDFSTGSFNAASEILVQGEKAGKEYFEVFKKLADSIKQIGPLHEVQKPIINQEYVFEDIIVTGLNNIDNNYILDKIQIPKGIKVDINYVEDRLQVVFGTLYFEEIWFEILGTPENQILKINVIERPKKQLRFSYHYDSENKGGVVVNSTWRNVFLKRSRAILEVDLATFPRATLDYFKYLGKHQNIAWQGTGVYSRSEMPAYDSLGTLNNLYESRLITGRLRFQTTKYQSSAFGAEVQWSNLNLKPKIADNLTRSISMVEYDNATFSIFHRFDNFNDRYFPTRGLRSELKFSTTTHAGGKVELGDTLTLDTEQLGDIIQTTQINTAELTIFPILPLTHKFSLLIKTRLKLSNLQANTLNLTDYDFIGGFVPNLINSNEYMGAGTSEFQMANYFYGRAGIQYQYRKNIYLQGFINYLDAEHPVKWFYPDADIGKFGDRYNRFALGGSIGYDSPAGPLAIAIAKDHYREGWQASLIIGFYY